jgi:hypothetical protein
VRIGDGVEPLSLNEYNSLTSLLVGDDLTTSWDESQELDLEFSVLSAFVRDRQHDGEKLPAPGLFLGTIVSRSRRDTPIEYFACIQPLCDSVRLRETTRFPLLPLATTKVKPFDLVVRDGGDVQRLSTHGVRFSQIEMEAFGPDTLGNVSARWDEERGWTFVSSRRTKYTWLGQLRPFKAQAFVNAVANGASRIGIEEYEFLRKGSRS